jgi:hypothetical protein
VSDESAQKQRLLFYGGAELAFAPFALFLAGVAWLGLSGAPDERGFWPILLAALTLGMLLARDRTHFSEVVIHGMSRPLVIIMILAWLLAGVLGMVMQQTGFVEAMTWLAAEAGVQGGAYVVAPALGRAQSPRAAEGWIVGVTIASRDARGHARELEGDVASTNYGSSRTSRISSGSSPLHSTSIACSPGASRGGKSKLTRICPPVTTARSPSMNSSPPLE